MTVKRKKDKITYNYDGNLEATLENSKRNWKRKAKVKSVFSYYGNIKKQRKPMKPTKDALTI